MNPTPDSSVTRATLRSGWCYALALGVLVLVALGLRLQGLRGSLSVDEAWAAAMITAPDFWAVAKSDVHPPLYYCLLRAAQHLTTSFAGLRLFSVGCGLGLVALAIGSFRKMPAGAVAAASAVALLPGFVVFSQQLRSYALLFLLLGLALAATIRVFFHPEATRTRLLLSLVLAAAAATHLIAVLFLPALVPLLLWPVRTHPPRAWVANLWPLILPGLLALWLKFFYITQPGALAGGWWISLEPGPIRDALREVLGWNEIQWLADATARHAPGNGWPVLAVTLAAALFAGGTAWRPRQHDPLVWLLLASAVIYFATVIAYSCLFEHLIMGRTLLPGLLPLLAGLARGIGLHPVKWHRSAAAAAVVLYGTLAAVPVARRAATPDAGLRGLAAATTAACRPGDLVVPFRAMDFGLSVYHCPPAGTGRLFLDQTKPAEPQLKELARRLAALEPGRRVLVVFRDDFYHQKFLGVFDQAVAEIARHGRTLRVAWHEKDLTLIVADTTNAPNLPP